MKYSIQNKGIVYGTVIAVVSILFGSSSASATTARVAIEPNTGAILTIANEGNCDLVSVVTETLNNPSVQSTVSWDYDENCNVINITGVQSRQIVGRATCNYIHSSQTVQDVINVDIAKLRFHTQRCWTGTSTYWGSDLWVEASTGVNWDHAQSAYLVSTGASGASSSSTGAGDFHSDWLWCNMTASWQVITLENTNKTFSNGSYSASYYQNRACPGTHMATLSKTSSIRTW